MALDGGYVKIFRKFTNWEWYDDINTSRLFIHLLFTANWKKERWRGETIERGQRITSVSKLADETNLSIKNIRTSLKKLQSTGEISVKAANKYTLITVEKYSDYQDEDIENGKQRANERQTKGNK